MAEAMRGVSVLTCWIAVGLLQTQVDSARRLEIAQAITSAQSAAQARSKTVQTAEERRRFEEKFNRLITALDNFQREYNASSGQVWPAKQALELKKALKDLRLP
jgi:soluble cytochrome b562